VLNAGDGYAPVSDWPDARDQAHPCRPTVSCTADIVAPGRLEVEAGALDAGTASGAAYVITFPVLLKLTLTALVQVQVGSNGYTLADTIPAAHYLDNVYFGPKLHLRDQGPVWPSLAVSAQLSLPTFQATGYSRSDDVFLTGFASKDVAFLHFDWNVGALLWRVDGSPAAQGFTAFAASPTLPAPFGASLEAYYFSDAGPVAPHDGGVRVVGSLTPRPWAVFDLGADVGFFPATRAYSLFAGLTVIPVVLFR
jgi:hypothetical protein